MQHLADEPGEQAPPSRRREHTEHGGQGQQSEDDEAGAAVEVPQQWVRAGRPSCRVLLAARPATGAHHRAVGGHQPGGDVAAREPRRGVVAEHDRRRTGRVGRDRGATSTARRGPDGRTGAPVRGSSRWWYDAARRQRRTRVLEVARPPCSSQTVSPGSPGRSETATAHGSAVGTGDREVTADADQRAAGQLPGERRRDEVGREGLAGGAPGRARCPRYPDGVVPEADQPPGGGVGRWDDEESPVSTRSRRSRS